MGVGLEAGEAARLEIWILVNDYLSKAEQDSIGAGLQECSLCSDKAERSRYSIFYRA